MSRPQNHAPRAQSHLTIGLVAAVLSVVLHAAVALFVSRIDVVPGKQRLEAERAHKVYEAFRLRDQAKLTPGVEERVLEELRRSGVIGEQPLENAIDELVPDPSEAVTEPPAASQEGLAAQEGSVLEPSALPSRDEWTPRQEILAIEDLAVADEVPGFERKFIPIVERVKEAKPVQGGGADLSGEMIASLTAPVTGGDVRPLAPLAIPDTLPPVPVGLPGDEPPEPVLDEVAPDSGTELFQETPDQITDAKPIEQMLTYRLETYRGLRDFRYGYFRLEIDRVGEQVLPHMPKDIVLVQDCSASLAEQRLYFCRRGLKQSLPMIGPEDRFNVASFKETLTPCFPDWATPSAANLSRAVGFIDGMKSGGNTDIDTSLRALLKLRRERGRPMVAVVITDGLANKGQTSSSQIISQFSRENAGEISVFTVGTFKSANTYLVDLLSYCNRGDVSIVRSGRWDIPDAIESIVGSVSRPVLGGLRLRLPADTGCELYPGQPTNLYLDRPLVLYGRYPKGENQLVIQALGNAGSLTCDTVFELAFTDDVKGRDKAIKSTWAKQKIYHLMGEYARTGDKDALKALHDTSHAYGEPVPYRQALAP
jgi:hypothetical protein